jgi:hypothetical protein
MQVKSVKEKVQINILCVRPGSILHEPQQICSNKVGTKALRNRLK